MKGPLTVLPRNSVVKKQLVGAKMAAEFTRPGGDTPMQARIQVCMRGLCCGPANLNNGYSGGEHISRVVLLPHTCNQQEGNFE